MEVSRGDLVTVVAPGDYGKPRPALVVQADQFAAMTSVIVLLMTSDLDHKPVLFRRRILPSKENGLKLPSEVMVDKIVSLARGRIGLRFGRLDAGTMQEVTVMLATLLGFPSDREEAK